MKTHCTAKKTGKAGNLCQWPSEQRFLLAVLVQLEPVDRVEFVLILYGAQANPVLELLHMLGRPVA